MFVSTKDFFDSKSLFKICIISKISNNFTENLRIRLENAVVQRSDGKSILSVTLEKWLQYSLKWDTMVNSLPDWTGLINQKECQTKQLK